MADSTKIRDLWKRENYKMSRLIQKIRPKLKEIKQIFREKTFKPYILDRKSYGIEFRFLIGDLTGEMWYGKTSELQSFQTSSESKKKKKVLEMDFVQQKMIKPRDIVFECGAHHGWMSILLSNWVGKEGKLVTFEAYSKNFNILRSNLELNHLENAVAEHYAVGSQSGKATIFQKSNASIIPRLIPRNFLSKRMLNFIYGMEEVETISLDTYAEQHKSYPTLLKIDVEGYEFEVLKGAKKILDTAPKILLEIHTKQLSLYGASIKNLFNLIDINRYQTWIQFETNTSPKIFDPKCPPNIQKRVHLYAIPK